MKRLPTDLAVSSEIPARGKSLFKRKQVPLHIALHFSPTHRPDITKIQGSTIASHPSIHPNIPPSVQYLFYFTDRLELCSLFKYACAVALFQII